MTENKNVETIQKAVEQLKEDGLAYKGILCSATEVKCSRQFYTVIDLFGGQLNLLRKVIYA